MIVFFIKETNESKNSYVLYRYWMIFIQEDTDRREGKGRCCCVRDRINSIPFRTTNLAPG